MGYSVLSVKKFMACLQLRFTKPVNLFIAVHFLAGFWIELLIHDNLSAVKSSNSSWQSIIYIFKKRDFIFHL